MENELTLVGTIAASFWMVNIVLVVGLLVLSFLLNFWSRETKHDQANSLQKVKWKCLNKTSIAWEGDILDWYFTFLIGEVLLGMILVAGLDILAKEDVLYPISAGILLILTLLYLPRFIIDLTKGLKMNHKSGDLEEINSLKKRLEQLEKSK